MSPSFEEGFAFLLAYIEVGVLHGVALAAGMPLFIDAGLTCSSVSAIIANIISRYRE